MMKKSLLLLALSAAISFNVQALDMPKSSRYDQRMQYINYNPNDVVVSTHSRPKAAAM